MMTNIGGGAMVVFRLRRPTVSFRCFAGSINSDFLRSELDRLHAEANSTRAKANSARMRLLRLSEAAENLRKQAAVNIQTGKENDARDLLIQKKKVMQALEKAKTRIEVLDKLSTKLNEAISFKETKLIGNISEDIEVDEEDNSGGIYIVSPKLGSVEVENEDDQRCESGDDSQSEFTLDIGKSFEESKVPLNVDPQDVSTSNLITEVSSYEVFLENLDQQLKRIEAELVTVLNASSLLLNREEKPKNLKVQQITEILDGICCVRRKISDMIFAEAKTN